MPITPRGEAPTDPELLRRLQAQLASAYTVESELGGGGMSRVFLAQDHALNRRVVIKVLPPSLAASVSVDRFHREIMLAAKLQHPHIVPVLAAGELGDLPYFVMPFIEGESLRPRIQRGPLSVRETVSIMRDVARALSFAHRLGIVHRDIKPDNILLAAGSAVVTDFGVAKAIIDSRNPTGIRAGSTITAIGVSLGTPQYMAPEQAAADRTADHRADLYALGIVGYEMLAGVPPFHGRSAQELLAAQLTEAPQPLTARRYDVPVALAHLIMQCLEKDPAKRPKTAADVVRVLETAEAVSGEFAAPTTGTNRTSRKRLIAAGLAVVILTGGGVWLAPRVSARAAAPQSTGTTVSLATLETVGAVVADTSVARAITSDLATALGNVDGLHLVIGGPPLPGLTVDPLTGTGPSMLLTGTVQRSGERIRVNLRLAAVRNDSTLWSGRFNGKASDLLTLEDEIAFGTISAIKKQISMPK
jgi:eukaryotic-like serine/threonine-protein kinase